MSYKKKDKVEKTGAGANLWEKIMQNEIFIRDIETIMFNNNNIKQEEAIEIIKNKLIDEEKTKQEYYKNHNLRPLMDLLNIKPDKILEKEINQDTDNDW
jgi:hypothetical protein